MALKTIKTALPEVIVFEPDIFTDKRGFFMELYHSEKYNELGLTASFVQDN
ncbi:MAG: dTDP-4-dehydrorhamnose 3,5-epimerase, partial [Deltaproteobacteria bacterium]|nr:dTDP-4-dehydrorhamnose 3,5-epimerase [Deltaproteobacteria bacterium]